MSMTTKVEIASSAVNDILSGEENGTSIRDATRRANLGLCMAIVRAVLEATNEPDSRRVEEDNPLDGL